MMKKILIATTALLLPFLGYAAVDKQFDAAQKEEIKQIIQEYLIENPHILFDMQAALEVKQQEMMKDIQLSMVSDVTADANVPFFGDMDTAELVLVEFIDFSCGFCRSMWPHVQRLVEEHDGKLAVKVVNSPILGEYSFEAAKVAQAIWEKDPVKWRAFQKEMMVGRSAPPKSLWKKIVESLELDWDEINTRAQSEEIAGFIQTNMDYAENAGLRGTPLYILSNGESFNGAVGFDVLNKAIRAAYESK